MDASGRDLWLSAGQELLRRGGVRSVKLAALADTCGRTTGSFYHHFDGMAPYLDALARYYGTDQVDAALASLADSGPAERLRRLAQMSREDRMGPLDAAMRDWAGSNGLAADAVRRADEAILRFAEAAFRELGHDRDGARVRALLLVSAGVARVQPPWRLPARTPNLVLEILEGDLDDR